MISKMPFSSGHTMSFKSFPGGHAMLFRSLRRSLFGSMSDHNQVHAMEVDSDSEFQPDNELESFQYHVFSQFNSLSESSPDEFLSLNWLSKLLDAFVSFHDDFNAILLNNAEDLSKPPLDKLLKEFFDRSIKALDICNAARDGIEKIQRWHKHLEIVSSALNSKQKKPMNQGQSRRAKKALTDLTVLLLDDIKDSGSIFSRRHRSFGHSHKVNDLNRVKSGYLRSLSWSVSSSWSANKQLQSMANSLIPPRAHEITATHGLASVIFTMGFVHFFVLWALVAAIPCQDRGVQTSFSIPKHFSWGAPLSALHVRIMDESKKRGRNSVGLLKEIYQMENSVHFMTNLVDSIRHFPLTEEENEKVKLGAEEVSMVSEAYENGLRPLERQVREVFHKIMSCRSESLEMLCRAQS